MLRFDTTTYRISDVHSWNERGEIKIAPEFQRRFVWTPRAKSYLIDSIVRGMPLPQFFFRDIVDAKKKKTVREVVDGQQRIMTMLDYLAGRFTVLSIHNRDIAGRTFDQLPERVQLDFLSYTLSVNTFSGAEDAELLEAFSRLNSYSFPLNTQEKLNAQYVGAFKTSMLELSRDNLAFWTRHKILTPRPIARMKDVELTCELVAAMMEGLQNQKRIIGLLYKRYDDAFESEPFVKDRFSQTLLACETIMDGSIAGTVFERSAVFYSLFAAVFDSQYGFGNLTGPRRHFKSARKTTAARERLIGLSEAMEADERSPEADIFYKSTVQSIDKLARRQSRHSVLRPIIDIAFE